MKVLIILFVCYFGVFAKKYDDNLELPPSIHPCRMNDEKLDICIRDSINYMIPSLRTKVDNIDLPSLEPIVYKAVNFTYKEIGKFTVKDFRGYGLSRAKVQNVKAIFKNNEIMYSSDFFVPKILLAGNYKGQVNFNNFHLSPKGQFNITLKSVSGKLNVKVKTVTVDGENYLHLYTFGLTPTVKEIKFAITGMFTDENLNRFVNEYINQNWINFYDRTIPEVKRQLEPIIMGIINRLFHQIPSRRLLIKN